MCFPSEKLINRYGYVKLLKEYVYVAGLTSKSRILNVPDFDLVVRHGRIRINAKESGYYSGLDPSWRLMLTLVNTFVHVLE